MLDLASVMRSKLVIRSYDDYDDYDNYDDYDDYDNHDDTISNF